MGRLRMVLVAVMLGLALLLAPGCNSADSQKFEAALQQTRTALADSQKQIADLKTAAEALPAGATKDKALEVLTKAEAARAGLEAKAAAVESVMVAAKSGQTDSIGPAVSSAISGIPVVGPYASIIGVVAGIGYGIWQSRKRAAETQALADSLAAESEHLTNVVKSIEVAGPDVTEADKKAIAQVQGPGTSLRVEEIKANL